MLLSGISAFGLDTRKPRPNPPPRAMMGGSRGRHSLSLKHIFKPFSRPLCPRVLFSRIHQTYTRTTSRPLHPPSLVSLKHASRALLVVPGLGLSFSHSPNPPNRQTSRYWPSSSSFTIMYSPKRIKARLDGVACQAGGIVLPLALVTKRLGNGRIEWLRNRNDAVIAQSMSRGIRT
jgi:hypothetical protein